MSEGSLVLLVEDEDFVRESLSALLESEGWQVAAAASAADARALLEDREPEVIVTDLRMPGEDGHAFIESLAAIPNVAPLVVLTGAGTITDAVRAFRNGAYDFLEKPVDPAHFVHVLKRAIEHASLRTKVARLQSTVEGLRGEARLVGSSSAMTALRALITQVAKAEVTVLIHGESGVGKEIIADSIHRESQRAQGNLVRVNCAALSESLFESEFFGHRRGAFTGATDDQLGHFERASGGTIFLDEIGTLPLSLQAKFLRVLETGEYWPVGGRRAEHADVRVLAATNEDLEAKVAEGAFRKDLFHRLNVFPITAPPLRDHLEDLPELVEHLVARMHAPASNGPLDPDALRLLEAYDWPGNVRELRSVLERCLILGDGRLPDADLLTSVLEVALPRSAAAPPSESFDLRERTRALERELILEALQTTGGHKREASELLGIDARNFAYYLKKHEIGDEEFGR